MTGLAINRQQRRGACPGLSAPMQTGDGLLVRLMPLGTIPFAAFIKLCTAAQEHGNGVIEITGRGSIQVRGLNAASAPRFADAITALDIAADDGIPILCNVLTGLDVEEIVDAGALAADLRRALARTSLSARLAPKVSVAIDGGGALNLDGIAADVRLRAEARGGSVALHVGVGGHGANAAQLGVIAPAQGIETAVRLLEVVAQRGREARARDVLTAEGAAPFRAALSSCLPGHDGFAVRSEAIGAHKLRDGSLAYGVGLAFGQTDAAPLERLAETAAAAGAIGMRAAAGRVLMIIGLTPATASAFVAAAENFGFIVRADDPRRHVIACAGAPVCSSAHIAARAIAPLVADAAGPRRAGALPIHISGCGKGCAHAGRAALTIVGAADGCAVIAGGSVHDAPLATVAIDELPRLIAKLTREAESEGGHV